MADNLLDQYEHAISNDAGYACPVCGGFFTLNKPITRHVHTHCPECENDLVVVYQGTETHLECGKPVLLYSEAQHAFFKALPECKPLSRLDDHSILFIDTKDPYRWPRCLKPDGTCQNFWDHFDIKARAEDSKV